MDTTRINRVLTAYIEESQSAEILLLKSFFSPEIPQRTGDNITDLILGAYANNVPADILYSNELTGISTEADWCHAKITNTPLPTYSLQELNNSSEYDLAHIILWCTDFSRQPIIDLSAVDIITTNITKTLDLDIKADLYLCLLGLSQTLLLSDISELLDWFDNTWDGMKNHTALVIGMILARIG